MKKEQDELDKKINEKNLMKTRLEHEIEKLHLQIRAVKTSNREANQPIESTALFSRPKTGDQVTGDAYKRS
jgi:outer membrane murein-binding lipoprotein Lpp